MKKSELYHLAQIAVVNSPSISPENKVEVLKVLIEGESFEKFNEDQEAKKAAENAGEV